MLSLTTKFRVRVFHKTLNLCVYDETVEAPKASDAIRLAVIEARKTYNYPIKFFYTRTTPFYKNTL